MTYSKKAISTTNKIFQVAFFLGIFLFTACNSDQDFSFEKLDQQKKETAIKNGNYQEIMQLLEEHKEEYPLQEDWKHEGYGEDATVMNTRKVMVKLAENQAPIELEAAIIDGDVVVEGDIVLGKESDLHGHGAIESRGMFHSDWSKRWNFGEIPYEIEANHPLKSLIDAAIAEINAQTNLTLFPRNGNSDYVRFVLHTTQLNSWVGRQGGGQIINLTRWASKGNIMHEILHSAGMWHEQSRCDRDHHVDIIWSNVQSGYEHNFSKQCDEGTDFSSYDYGSIMHYGAKFFGTNSSITILPKIGNRDIFHWMGLISSLGQRTALSAQDIKTINAIYPLQAGKIHRIVANHSNKALTVNSNNAVVQTTYNASASSQHFLFHGAGEGYYYIRHRDSNKFMEVSGSLTTNGSKIVLANYSYNAPRQLFKLVPAGEGAWNIYPKNSTKCLDIQWSSQANNAPLMLWGLNGNPNQQFKLK